MNASQNKSFDSAQWSFLQDTENVTDKLNRFGLNDGPPVCAGRAGVESIKEITLASRRITGTDVLTASGSNTSSEASMIKEWMEVFFECKAVNINDGLKEIGLTTDGMVLGSGGFGEVTEWTKKGKALAVKVIRPIHYKGEEVGLEKGEILGLNLKPHPNLVTTHGILLKKKELNHFAFITSTSLLTESIKEDYHLAAIISDIAPGKEWWDLINDDEDFLLNNKKVTDVGKDIVFALEQLHDNNIIYRDLKPQNVFYDGTARLIDYGFLKNIGPLHRTGSFKGTLRYLAPEVWNNDYGFPYDAWSLGCFLMECVTGKVPANYSNKKRNMETDLRNAKAPNYMLNAEHFAVLSDNEKIRLIVNSKLEALKEDANSELLGIMVGLLKYNEQERMTMKDASRLLSELSSTLNEKTGKIDDQSLLSKASDSGARYHSPDSTTPGASGNLHTHSVKKYRNRDIDTLD